jgi:hypothetical protein
MKINFKTYLLNEDTKIPKILIPLAQEALKYKTFDDFERAFLVEIKHGRYYHVTEDPNFKIDPHKGPRDLTSLSGSLSPSVGKLMITSDLENWTAQFPNRKYVAIVDMSKVEPSKYKQVNRGFGNEFFVSDPQDAKILKVVSRAAGLSDSRRYQEKLENYINSSDDLKRFYNNVLSGGLGKLSE